MSKSMMNGMKVLQKESGFTLVELLVALTILAIGLLGVLGMQVFAIRGNAFASNMSIAQNIAAQKIEYYKNFAYNVIWTRNAAGDPIVVVFGDNQTLGDIGEGPGVQAGIATDILPEADRLAPVTGNDVVSVDVEPYGGLMRSHNDQPDGTPNTLEDSDNNEVPDPPFDRFRRVTIIKVINGKALDDVLAGYPPPPIADCTMVIKVLVYWKGPEGVEHKVVMMSTKSMGG